ncbi:hypothetical protein [Methanobacterium ferruginis]|nr:hypothetical protein [Methanobacterium ferruginis]
MNPINTKESLKNKDSEVNWNVLWKEAVEKLPKKPVQNHGMK